MVNWVKQVKKEKQEEKQKEKKDYLIIDQELFEKLESFESLFNQDKDKKNRLAGLLCESRKKDKKKRKERFVYKSKA